MCKIKLILLTGLCFFVNTKSIIWDLDEVLLRSDRFTMVYNIGLWDFIKYMVYDFKNPNIRPIVFDVLSDFNKTLDCDTHLTLSNGIMLPDIISSWLRGDLESQEIMLMCKDHVRELFQQGYFYSKLQKRLVYRTIRSIFTPDLFAKTITIKEPGLRLVKECSKKHDNYILSNWDRESFKKVYSLNPRLFNIFNKDHICISGECHLLKPNPEIYTHLLNKFKLEAKDCVFIDDKFDNVDAARSLGMEGIWLKNNNYDQVRNTLIKLGIIDK